MTRSEIVEQLAREHVVEDIVRRVCRSRATEMEDLAQYVYYVLLTYSEACIVDLWRNGREQLEAFIVRVVMNNYYSRSSPYFYAFVEWRLRWRYIIDGVHDDEEQEREAAADG